MRSIGNELLSRLVKPSEASLHFVERHRQLAQLVLGPHGNGVCKSSCCNLFGCPLKPFGTLSNSSRYKIADDKCDEKCEASRAQDISTDQRDAVVYVCEVV